MTWFRPLHDVVLVRRAEIREKVGLLYVPPIAQEPPQQGVAIAVGPGYKDQNGVRIPMDVQAGDTVLFGRFTGSDVEIDGESYLVMREPEIIARVPGK